MGQFQASSCLQPEQDIFLHQIRVYRWRADPNVNHYLPRVYFKSAFAQLQQEKFKQFLEHQQNKQYFCVSKFKEELAKIPHPTDDEVVVFESYECSLARIHSKMTLQQSIYALQGLLTGYQEIKKVYQAIKVDPNCCFFTTQGSIRAWINPNVKLNSVWKVHEGQSSRHNIILQITKMVQQYTEYSRQSEDFFRNLNYNIAYQYLKNCGFSEVRRWIVQYCHIQKIQIAKKVSPNKKANQLSKVKESKIYKRNTVKTQTSQRPAHYKENNPLFQSTQQSQFHRPFNKMKSLQKNIAPFRFQEKSINLPYSTVTDYQRNFPLQHNTSQPYKLQAQPINYSVLIQTPGQSKIIHKSTILAKQAQQNDQKIKQSQIISNRNVKDANIVKQCQPILGKQLVEQQIQVQLDRLSISSKKVTKVHQNKQESNRKKAMQASIIQNIQQRSQLKKQIRYKTFNDRQLSQNQSSQHSAYSRHWITTKTITKLISDHQDKYSLKNSFAESSDYYNDSGYSGVLTQMGREVTKPVHEARSKTLGASQQF